MAHLHCWRRIKVQTWIWIPNLMATLYYAEHAHVAQTSTQIPTIYSVLYRNFESESVSESVSGNVNEPLDTKIKLEILPLFLASMLMAKKFIMKKRWRPSSMRWRPISIHSLKYTCR